jgi:hypothetical protein
MPQVDVQELTADERAEVEHELEVMRLAEGALLAVEPVSPEASIRRMETLGRLRLEIDRVAGLLSRPGASVTCPTCHGTGGGQYNDCPTCDGNGVIA